MLEVIAPDKFAQTCARGRQALFWDAVAKRIDALLIEAAQARVSAFGLLEVREWAMGALEELACQTAPDLVIEPDAVKDALAECVAAAQSGNQERYAAARQAEADARMKVAA